jgi:phenylacetate-CoA ligase
MPMPDSPVYDEREYLSGELLEQLRVQKLRSQIAYCYDRSEFYREKLDGIGVKAQDIRTWADFRRLPPLLTKFEENDERELTRRTVGHPFGRTLACDPKDLVVTAASSGTSGIPSFYIYTRKDLDQFFQIAARYLWRVGVRPGDGVIHGSGQSMWTATLHQQAVTAMGGNSIPVGAEAGSERILRFAELCRPKAIFCTPSMANYLAEKAPSVLGMQIAELGLEILILGSEPGAGLPEVRAKLSRSYGETARIFDLIGPSSPFSYVSCGLEEYYGMHELTPDMSIWADDLIDPDTLEPIEVTNGAVGMGLMTDLEREAGPALKYWYGDILQVFTDPCPCGLPGTRIKILGRADDMLIVKGVNVFPSAIQNLVASVVPQTTGHIRIILDSPPPLVRPPLRLIIEHGPDVRGDNAINALRENLVERMHNALRIRPEIELVPPDTLPRATKKTAVIEHRYRDK